MFRNKKEKKSECQKCERLKKLEEDLAIEKRSDARYREYLANEYKNRVSVLETENMALRRRIEKLENKGKDSDEKRNCCDIESSKSDSFV